MSILLEALKKSEQERQLGKTPTLQSGSQDQAAGAQTGNPWIVLSMAVISLGVMGWFGWQQFLLPQGADVAAIVAEPGEDASGPEQAAPQPRTMTESFQSAEQQGLVQAPAAPSDGSEQGLDNRASLAQSVSKFTAENDEPAPVAPVETGSETDEPQVADSPPAVTTEEALRPGIEPHVSEPISYWQLPQGIRDNLPEIKITVLVYAAEPDDRFLLSNGQRLVEKDQLDGGLVLEEIRKDGAVFMYRNYRFLVKG